jgi:endo-1,4-beta-xylanase
LDDKLPISVEITINSNYEICQIIKIKYFNSFLIKFRANAATHSLTRMWYNRSMGLRFYLIAVLSLFLAVFCITCITPANSSDNTVWNELNVPEKTIIQKHSRINGKNNVLQFKPASGGYDWNVVSYDLTQYIGQSIEITMSFQLWLDAPARILWQINNQSQGYPVISGGMEQLSPGRWYSIQGSGLVTIQPEGHFLYFTSYEFYNTSGYIADLDIKINPVVFMPDDNIPALHTKWPFPVGTSVFAGDFSQSNPLSGLLRHYNTFTVATLYPALIMPEPWTPAGAYRWTNTDALVNYAEANGKKMRGHVLFWHQTIPLAFFKGSGKGGWATMDELYSRMEHHAKTVFEKYGGRISWWDICNEVVSDSGGPRQGIRQGMGNNLELNNFTSFSLYTQIMEDAGKKDMDRYEYVLKAFQYARKYADANGGQNVKLILTDYGIEARGTKQTEFLRLLDYLFANNAPVDGVGIQGHLRYDFSKSRITDFANAIDAFSSKKNPVTGRNLTVQVCELDLSLYREDEANWNDLSSSKKTLTAREFETRQKMQIALYRDLFDMFEQKYNQGKLDMVVFWGVADRESWLNWYPVSGRTDSPLIFDRYYQPKAAYYELIRGR